jgi:hypothetical protein
VNGNTVSGDTSAREGAHSRRSVYGSARKGFAVTAAGPHDAPGGDARLCSFRGVILSPGILAHQVTRRGRSRCRRRDALLHARLEACRNAPHLSAQAVAHKVWEASTGEPPSERLFPFHYMMPNWPPNIPSWHTLLLQHRHVHQPHLPNVVFHNVRRFDNKEHDQSVL